MRVLMVPHYAENPYQARLSEALEAQGVPCTLSNGFGPAPVTGALRTYGAHDVVHLHWPDPFVLRRRRGQSARAAASLLRQLAAARRDGAAVVWTVHNLLSHDRRHPVVQRLTYALLARLADGVVVHSEAARETLRRACVLSRARQRKVAVIPHGTFAGSYPDTMTRAQARDSLGVDGASLVFAFFGRLRAYRGLDRLLADFSRVEDPRARLLVAGRPEGPAERDAVDAAARRDPRIRPHLGYVPDDEVQCYLKAADAVVLPYSDVLTSGAAVLAMTFARAVVAPRLGGLPELLAHQEQLLYEPDHPDGLLAALARAQTSDLTAIGTANSAKAAALGWDLVATATIDVYRRGRRLPLPQPPGSSAAAWTRRAAHVRRTVDATVPHDAALVLIDDEQLGQDVAGDRAVRSLLERDGAWHGTPVDGRAAVASLVDAERGGCHHVVVAWTSFWWLEHFPELRDRLSEEYGPVHRGADALVFRQSS